MALYQGNYCNYFSDSWGVSIQIAAHAVLIQLTAAAAASASVMDEATDYEHTMADF